MGGREEERIVFSTRVFADLWRISSLFSYNEEGCIIYASAPTSSNTFGSLVFAGGAQVYVQSVANVSTQSSFLFSVGIYYY